MAAWPMSVSPDWPQPGPIRIVGSRRPSAIGSGNQWMRITVPSKDVRLKSVELPATGTALVDCHPAGGRQVVERSAPEAKAVADADDERTGTHALKTRAQKTTRL